MNEAFTYPNDVAKRTVWKPARNLSERIDYVRTAPAAPFQNHTYAYDELGRPTSRTDVRESTAHPEERASLATKEDKG